MLFTITTFAITTFAVTVFANPFEG